MQKKIVIVDIDGTLSFLDHRLHYIKGKSQDWNAFYKACPKDEPNEPMIHLVQALHATGHEVIIVSGRSDIVFKETVAWLDKYEVPFDQIYLRQEGIYTKDYKLKKRLIFQTLKIKPEKILLVLEDRTSVVEMWRSMGIMTLQNCRGDF